LAIASVAADVAGGHVAALLEAGGEGLKAENQIVDDAAVLLSEARKHQAAARGIRRS
jgi:hypothetical protein